MKPLYLELCNVLSNNLLCLFRVCRAGIICPSTSQFGGGGVSREVIGAKPRTMGQETRKVNTDKRDIGFLSRIETRVHDEF